MHTYNMYEYTHSHKHIYIYIYIVPLLFLLTVESFNRIKFKEHKLASSAEKLMDCQSKEIPVFGEYSVEAQIVKDKFQESVLVTKLDKCQLGRNSFITKMIFFNRNNFLTNSSEQECNQTNDTKAKFGELKKEYEDIFKRNPKSKVK